MMSNKKAFFISRRNSGSTVGVGNIPITHLGVYVLPRLPPERVDSVCIFLPCISPTLQGLCPTPPSHPNLSTPPSPPNQSSWVCRHLQGQVMSSLTTSFPPIALPFSHFVPSPQQGEHGFEVSSVQFSRSVVSASLRPRGRQHTRPPCPSPAPEACSNSCPPIGVLPLAGGAEKLRSFSEPVSTSVTQEW